MFVLTSMSLLPVQWAEGSQSCHPSLVMNWKLSILLLVLASIPRIVWWHGTFWDVHMFSMLLSDYCDQFFSKMSPLIDVNLTPHMPSDLEVEFESATTIPMFLSTAIEISLTYAGTFIVYTGEFLGTLSWLSHEPTIPFVYTGCMALR